MISKNRNSFKWVYLPVVISSAAILTSQLSAGEYQAQDAQQVQSLGHQYVGGRTRIGVSVTDDGDASADINHVFSETQNSSTSGGLWAGIELDGDDKGINEGGVQINHNWVARDRQGNATHVNKAFAAYDRNSEDDAKVTVGYGQERRAGFWEGHVSKGVSDKRLVQAATATTKAVYEKAFDYGVGASVGTHLASTNTKITAGLDHQWGDEMASDEDTAMMTTLSAGVQQYFQGTPHSVGLNVAASRTKGGYDGDGDTETSANLNYNYEFGGGSIYQPDQRYRRVRVEIPGKGRAATYAKKPVYTKQPIYKNQPVYKNQPIYKKEPVYTNKTVRVPTGGTMAKSTVELEGQTFFKHGSAVLIPSAQQRLRQISAEIRKHGYKGNIRITGNSCGLPDMHQDKVLSEQRASAVRNFMIAQGFNPAHLQARGLGATHPKYSAAAGQDFKNRRVDIEYVTERQQRINGGGFRNETKRVQNGFRNVITGYKRIQTGTKNVQVGVRNVQTGTTDILVSQGVPGTPRVIWRTEAIATTPAWITRALRSTFDHNRSVDTYRTTAGQDDLFNTDSNSAPTANSDSVTVSQGKGAYISVLDNDNDSESTVSIHEFGQGMYGSVTQEGDQLIYTANSDYVGQDSFTYTIVDDGGLKSEATVYVTVTATSTGNAAPVATNDMASTVDGQNVLIDVTANDTDDGGDVSVTSVSSAGNGSATIENGQVRYTPNSGYVGVDTFTYTIVDSEGLTDTATVSVTVTANGSVNTAPIAVDDTATTNAGEAVSIHVIDNDSDNESAFSITEFGQGSNGSVVNSNGKLVYTPNADFFGTDSFTYTIVDDGGLTATATVTVTVNKVASTNNAPIAIDDNGETKANNSVTINVLGNDFDYDEGDLATLKSHDSSSKYGGTVVTQNSQLTYTPATDFVGTDTFTYVIEDKFGLTSTATVTIVVSSNGSTDGNTDGASCNMDCTIAYMDDELTSKNTAVTIDVLSNDSGTGLNIVEVSQGANGHVTISGNKVVYTPVNNFVGNDVFWYKIVDAAGYATSNKVMVYVVDDSKK